MDYRDITLKEINNYIPLHLLGEDCHINGLNLCNRETKYESILGYTTSELFFEAIFNNKSVRAIVITKELFEKLQSREEMIGRNISYLISDTPETMFYEIQNLLCKKTSFYKKAVKSKMGKGCKIHPSAVIEEGAIIGNNVYIGANSVIEGCVEIGDNTFIGSCSVIGEDGFQAIHGMKEHVYHSGGVRIGKGVTIGNNTSICRSLFEGETIVGDYSKIDNLVQISHNCVIGDNCTICAGSILLGSSSLEDNAYIAPGSMIMNQKVVGEGAFVGTMSYVNKSIKPGSQVFGIPARKIPQL